jgi:hypothetical protein
LIGAHETEAALARVHLAEARADVALHPSVGSSCQYLVPIVDGGSKTSNGIIATIHWRSGQMRLPVCESTPADSEVCPPSGSHFSIKIAPAQTLRKIDASPRASTCLSVVAFNGWGDIRSHSSFVEDNARRVSKRKSF